MAGAGQGTAAGAAVGGRVERCARGAADALARRAALSLGTSVGPLAHKRGAATATGRRGAREVEAPRRARVGPALDDGSAAVGNARVGRAGERAGAAAADWGSAAGRDASIAAGAAVVRIRVDVDALAAARREATRAGRRAHAAAARVLGGALVAARPAVLGIGHRVGVALLDLPAVQGGAGVHGRVGLDEGPVGRRVGGRAPSRSRSRAARDVDDEPQAAESGHEGEEGGAEASRLHGTRPRIARSGANAILPVVLTKRGPTPESRSVE